MLQLLNPPENKANQFSPLRSGEVIKRPTLYPQPPLSDHTPCHTLGLLLHGMNPWETSKAVSVSHESLGSACTSSTGSAWQPPEKPPPHPGRLTHERTVQGQAERVWASGQRQQPKNELVSYKKCRLSIFNNTSTHTGRKRNKFRQSATRTGWI